MTIKLPTECLIKIFEQFTVAYNQESIDYVTLRSCSLVNRQWCAMAIPMLWKEPFLNLQLSYLHKATENRIHMPITTYIMCLSDEAKTILSKCGIIITPILKRKPTFNYASYLQNLDNLTLFDATERWVDKCNTIPKEERHFIPIFQIYQLLDQLFKNFIQNCVNLKQLRLKKSNQMNNLSDALSRLYLLPGAETSLNSLNEFTFDGCMESEILSKASEISKNIQHLGIDCVCHDNEGLAKLIQVQQRPLLSLSIENATSTFEHLNIKNSLSNKVNSLTSLSINRIFSLDIFSNCNNLERLKITHKDFFNENLMKKFVNTKFNNLHEIQFLLDHPFLYQISTLIKNTNKNLTSINLYWIIPRDINNFTLLISTIIMNCPNLERYLGFYANELLNHYLPLFFEKCSKLEYLYIYDNSNNNNNNNSCYDISNVMNSISNVIPKNLKLMWLSKSWSCNIESLNLFLESCEKRLSEPLLLFIGNRTNQHNEIIREYTFKNVLRC